MDSLQVSHIDHAFRPILKVLISILIVCYYTFVESWLSTKNSIYIIITN